MALRIVFMGSPEFAIPSLDTLRASVHDVVAVITAVDKFGGRGKRVLITSAVKQYAMQHGIPILQPPNLKSPEFVRELEEFEADLFVVVAFRMLPEIVWGMPRLGTMNLHGSLLPKYRGAAPINWAVIQGEEETGVTTFLLKHAIDTGDILIQKSMQIGPHDTAGIVHDRMKILGAQVVLESVNGIAQGTLKPSPQNDEEATKAPKIHHETCQIDFDNPTEKVYNFIRGLSPYPTAWTTLDNAQFNIFSCRPLEHEPGHRPGELLTDHRSYLHITTQDGAIALQTVQLEGRKRMAVRDFLNGYALQSKTVGLRS